MGSAAKDERGQVFSSPFSLFSSSAIELSMLATSPYIPTWWEMG